MVEVTCPALAYKPGAPSRIIRTVFSVLMGMKITSDEYRIQIECESEHEVVKALAVAVGLAVEMKPNVPVFPALASTASHLREALKALQWTRSIPEQKPAQPADQNCCSDSHKS